MLYNKKLIVTTLLSAVVVFVGMTSMQTKEDEKPFTNLKVLPKNITHDEMEKVMHDWSASLGQRCGFCHARDAQTNKTDFASDAKPEKLMARKMMTMTAKINKKYFKQDKDEQKGEMMAALTCYTCHNGKAQPETKAPQRGPGGQGQGGQKAPSSATPPPTTPPGQ